MPINIVMKNIGIKTCVPAEHHGQMPEYPVSLIEVEEGGAVNTVSISENDARYLVRNLEGWFKIIDSNKEDN